MPFQNDHTSTVTVLCLLFPAMSQGEREQVINEGPNCSPHSENPKIRTTATGRHFIQRIPRYKVLQVGTPCQSAGLVGLSTIADQLHVDTCRGALKMSNMVIPYYSFNSELLCRNNNWEPVPRERILHQVLKEI